MVDIIAEIGVNHDGCLTKAKSLIDSAKYAGAHCVKFQSYRADLLAAGNPDKANYQQIQDGISRSHLEMLKALELSQDDQRQLFDYCNKIDIEFMSTPYDINSLYFLLDLGVARVKTASADLTDLDLHKHIAKSNCDVIISTGMSSLGEIDCCLNEYSDSKGIITLLHCTSNYPCSDKSLNLKVIKTLKSAFNANVGYSDHSQDHIATIMAISLGAQIIEKHITINRNDPGPDHRASMEIDEFKQYCDYIKRSQIMLGDKIKKPQPEELSMMRVSRKSLTAWKDIKEGELLDDGSMIMARPGTGLQWKYRDVLIGLKANKNINKGDQINITDFS